RHRCSASADCSSVIVSYSARKLWSIAISKAARASTSVSSRSKMTALSPVREGALAAMSATSVGALGTQVLRERFEAGEGRFLAEDFHRLEQGRRDPAPGDRGAQRPECEAGFDLHLLHEHLFEGGLQRIGGEALEVTQHGDRALEHLQGVVPELRAGIVSDLDLLIGAEEEPEHPHGLPEQGHAFLHERSPRGEPVLLAGAEFLEGPR